MQWQCNGHNDSMPNTGSTQLINEKKIKLYLIIILKCLKYILYTYIYIYMKYLDYTKVFL
jgi:hypothetical protein